MQHSPIARAQHWAESEYTSQVQRSYCPTNKMRVPTQARKGRCCPWSSPRAAIATVNLVHVSFAKAWQGCELTFATRLCTKQAVSACTKAGLCCAQSSCTKLLKHPLSCRVAAMEACNCIMPRPLCMTGLAKINQEQATKVPTICPEYNLRCHHISPKN